MSTPKKYIDSHWLVFATQGIIALLFGWFMAFTGIGSVTTLVVTVAVVLLCFGVIELSNLLNRTRQQETWGLSLAIAVAEILVALALLFTLNQNTALHMSIIGAYTLVRGVLEIIVGLRSVDDRTDKTIWTICGICGAILGFVIINSGHLRATEFLKAFGIYMIIFGISSLIYGIHNHDQKLEYKAARSLSAKKSAATRKKTATKATTSTKSKKTAVKRKS